MPTSTQTQAEQGSIFHTNEPFRLARLRETIVTHGHYKSKEYKVWAEMIQRCTNHKNKSFKNYGGRGISVCREWMKFDAFIKDMGLRPSPKHTIERIDNNNGYSKSNCVWATIEQQRNNSRRNKLLAFGVLILNQRQWEKRQGFKKNTILHRLGRGWTIEKAITTPVL